MLRRLWHYEHYKFRFCIDNCGYYYYYYWRW